MPAGETQACCPPCWQQGSCSLGGQWGGGRGRGTSDQQVLAKGDQDRWHLPDGAESASAGFHRRCWVQPGTELWCLIVTTGFSDHRASSWHGPCLLMGPGLFPWVGSSLPRTEGWQLGARHPPWGTATITPCATLSLGQCTYHFSCMTPGLGPCWPQWAVARAAPQTLMRKGLAGQTEWTEGLWAAHTHSWTGRL